MHWTLQLLITFILEKLNKLVYEKVIFDWFVIVYFNVYDGRKHY